MNLPEICRRGAVYAWSGNKEVGAGRMEIVLPQPSTRLLINLDLSAPFEALNMVEFTLLRQGEPPR